MMFPTTIELVPSEGIDGQVRALVPLTTTLTVTCLPHHGIERTIRPAVQQSGLGYSAIPHQAFRRRRPQLHQASKYRMPGGVPMVWVVFAFFPFVLWALTTQPDSLLALLATPVGFFILLGAAWFALRGRPGHLARYATFQAELAQDLEQEESPIGREFGNVKK